MTTSIDPASISPAPKVRLDDLYKQDPALRDKIAAEKKEAQTAIDTLKQSRIDLEGQKKAMAMQRVQRIKASIQALKMSGIIDSKVLARMAAKLAKELAAAVKDFIAAGGKPDLVNATSDMAKTNTDINIKGGVNEKGEPIAAGEEPSSDAFVQAVDKEIKEAAAKYEAQQNSVGVSSSKDEDKAFGDMVRDAIEELKKILKAHKQVYNMFGKKEDPEFEEAEKALREVERLLGGSATAVSPPDTHQLSIQS